MALPVKEDEVLFIFGLESNGQRRRSDLAMVMEHSLGEAYFFFSSLGLKRVDNDSLFF